MDGKENKTNLLPILMGVGLVVILCYFLFRSSGSCSSCATEIDTNDNTSTNLNDNVSEPTARNDLRERLENSDIQNGDSVSNSGDRDVFPGPSEGEGGVIDEIVSELPNEVIIDS